MRIPALAITTILCIGSLQTSAQSRPEPSLQDGIAALQKQIGDLRATIEEMKTEIVRARAEAQELRQTLQASREQLNPSTPSASADQNTTTIPRLEEDQQLLNAKIDEQYQTKVESASKYRVRLSGTVLMNLFNNRGAVDNLDFPTLATEENPIYPRGSIGGSLRQSLLGLEVFGPEIKGAKVSGDLQFDFAGGFPNAPDGVTFGLARLRTGNIRLSWPKTTLIAGQDAPFFSPLSPSSIASVALPAFSYSGNLWTWIPQVRLEHRLDLTSDSNLLFQGGLLDPLTGEFPPLQFLRAPQAGEASRQPASAARLAWSHRMLDHEFTVGAGGYYGRHNWGFHRNVDAWAGSSDWTMPLGRWEFSGEFYRGRALGGLGGGFGQSVLFSGPITDALTQVRGLNSIGGWAQVKFRQTEKLEWNGAYGQDNVPARDLRLFAPQQIYYDSAITRNQSSLVNFIFRPRSDLLLSLEYRRIRTLRFQTDTEGAHQINLSMGVLF